MSAFREVDIAEYADAFFRQWGPGRLRMLILTFQFDPQLFEQRFARVLGRGAIRIDVVSGESPTQPKREPYNLWLANWRGTFHPKMIVLMANDHVAVGLGSANLTWGGLGGNLECWQFFGDTAGDRVLLANINAFLASLDQLRVLSKKIDLSEILQGLPAPEIGTVHSTSYGQLLAQVTAKLKKPVRRLDILSPLNSDPSALLAKLRHALGIQEVHLYTNMGANKVPPIAGCDHYYDLVLPSKVEEENQTVRHYEMLHAKMFAFHSGKHVDLFWGSANASASAWLRTGTKANIDFLVHSRITLKEWMFLRDKLPARHRWQEKSPAEDGTLPKKEPVQKEEVRLLNAVWDGKKLVLEASGCEPLAIWLESSKAKLRLQLSFQSGEASVPKNAANRLGFVTGPVPALLHYRIEPNRNWHEVPVNLLGLPPVPNGITDVASLLFWRYTGRLLPTGANHLAHLPVNGNGTGEVLDHEEEELTQTLHQGALDRFVLQWRLNVRRIVACSGKNASLLKQRLEEARCLIRKESEDRPELWPFARRRFVEELFQGNLRTTEWLSSKK